MAGVYLMRAKFIMICAQLVLCIPLYFSKEILLAIGVSPLIAELAS